MTWIATVPEDEATGRLKELYGEQRAMLGFTSNFYAAFSLKPEALDMVWAMLKVLGVGSSGLGRRKEELIAVVVSALNHNHYCQNGHGERLRALIGDGADTVKTDWRMAELAPDEVAMLDFCEKATLRNSPMTEADVAKLRAAGFSDTDILEIVLMIGLRQFCNVIGDTLGVEPYFRAKEADSPN